MTDVQENLNVEKSEKKEKENLEKPILIQDLGNLQVFKLVDEKEKNLNKNNNENNNHKDLIYVSEHHESILLNLTCSLTNINNKEKKKNAEKRMWRIDEASKEHALFQNLFSSINKVYTNIPQEMKEIPLDDVQQSYLEKKIAINEKVGQIRFFVSDSCNNYNNDQNNEKNKEKNNEKDIKTNTKVRMDYRKQPLSCLLNDHLITQISDIPVKFVLNTKKESILDKKRKIWERKRKTLGWITPSSMTASDIYKMHHNVEKMWFYSPKADGIQYYFVCFQNILTQKPCLCFINRTEQVFVWTMPVPAAWADGVLIQGELVSCKLNHSKSNSNSNSKQENENITKKETETETENGNENESKKEKKKMIFLITECLMSCGVPCGAYHFLLRLQIADFLVSSLKKFWLDNNIESEIDFQVKPVFQADNFTHMYMDYMPRLRYPTDGIIITQGEAPAISLDEKNCPTKTCTGTTFAIRKLKMGTDNTIDFETGIFDLKSQRVQLLSRTSRGLKPAFLNNELISAFIPQKFIYLFLNTDNNLNENKNSSENKNENDNENDNDNDNDNENENEEKLQNNKKRKVQKRIECKYDKIKKDWFIERWRQDKDVPNRIEIAEKTWQNIQEDLTIKHLWPKGTMNEDSRQKLFAHIDFLQKNNLSNSNYLALLNSNRNSKHNFVVKPTAPISFSNF